MVPTQELTKYFRTSLKKPLKDLVPFERKLRVSGFPYCGLKHAYEKITFVNHDSDHALKSYYCDVGTAAHAVFQRWLGVGGRIYGDWKCRNPKCKHVVHFSNKHRCPKCKHEMLYEEFTVKAFKHVTGHLDGVYKSLDGRYWVIDYKTSSMRVVGSQRREPTLPYAKNEAQIMSYCALIELMYDIEIAGWMLLYAPRDDPDRVAVYGEELGAEQKQRILKKIKKYDTQYETVLNLSDFDQMDYLIKTRACKTREFYVEHLQGFDGCPIEAVCFTNKLVPLINEVLETYLEGHGPNTVKAISNNAKHK